MQLPTSFSLVHLAIPVVLILLRVAYTQAKRLLGTNNSKKPRMSYVVKWGRERLHFPLPQPETKLSFIRQQLADYTQLPPHSFKLVHAGAVMKDDNAPISAYGIKEKSIIAIIGGGDNLPGSKSQAPERRTEESTIKQIRTELDKVRTTLQPDVDQFLVALNPTKTSTAADPEPALKGKPAPASSGVQMDLAQEHVRLGELLLQSLLRLDAITSEGEWEEARKERKTAVREVQGLLDRLDGGWRSRVSSRS